MTLRRIPRIVLAFVALCAVPASALADGWDCPHNIKENGVRSHFTISYFNAGSDPKPIGGPYHQIGWKGFYTGWPVIYDSLDAEFVPPKSIGFSVYPAVQIKNGVALFKRAGSEPVQLRVSSKYFSKTETPPRVHFRTKEKQQIAALLAHKDWTVEFRTRRGKLIDTVPHRFAVDLDGMRLLYDRHVAAMREMEKYIPEFCDENRDEEVI